MKPSTAGWSAASREASRQVGAGALTGAAALSVGIVSGHAVAALAALAASWLFFTGLAAGSVAMAAAIRLARGRWAGPVLPIADAGSRFFLPAVGLLGVLLVGAPWLLPWAAGAGAVRLAALVLRQIVPTAALFGAGAWHVAAARRPGDRDATAAAVTYLVAYAVALSLWAYDWVMSLAAGPSATAVPAFYFMGAFLSGIAWVALVAAVRGIGGADLRHDLGKLVFAFAVVWSYLLWAIYLAAWYGHLPSEAAPLLARWRGPLRPAALAVLGAVLAWPFGILLPEQLKRRRDALGAGAAVVLGGLWLERFLLVLPSVPTASTPFSIALELVVAGGVAALFIRAVRVPAVPRIR